MRLLKFTVELESSARLALMRVDSTELRRLLAQCSQLLLAEMEIEELRLRINYFQREIPTLKEEIARLSQMQSETEQDLAWVSDIVNELTKKNAELMSTLMEVKQNEDTVE
jgi:chromosome segregation ATPase